jgi:hypothetical protein
MNHPSLCPKTQDVFDPGGWLACYVGADTMLEEHFAAHRRFLARYQSCAWQDRAERWWSVWRRDKGIGKRSVYWHKAAMDADMFARLWREWEKVEEKK